MLNWMLINKVSFFPCRSESKPNTSGCRAQPLRKRSEVACVGDPSGEEVVTTSCRPAGSAEHHGGQPEPGGPRPDRPAASRLRPQDGHRAHHQRRFPRQGRGRVGSDLTHLQLHFTLSH